MWVDLFLDLFFITLLKTFVNMDLFHMGSKLMLIFDFLEGILLGGVIVCQTCFCYCCWPLTTYLSKNDVSRSFFGSCVGCQEKQATNLKV